MSAPIGQNVVIVGGNLQAVDVAQYLLANGKKVTIVMPDSIDRLGRGQSSWVKTFTNPMLKSRASRIWQNASVSAVGEGSITVQGETGVDMIVKCDTLIEAMDMVPNKALVDELAGIDVYAVGDCNSPFNIAEAIYSGNVTARSI